MKKRIIALALVLVISFSIIVGGILFIHLGEGEESGKLYMFPISVGEKVYTVTVRSNYSSAPKVYLPEVPENLVSVDFMGDPEIAFCNITIPTDLIWGELTVIDKYYEMDEADYILSSNSTDNSIYFTFDHNALIKHFEVRGTEGAVA
jgi:hypothetical protein